MRIVETSYSWTQKSQRRAQATKRIILGEWQGHEKIAWENNCDGREMQGTPKADQVKEVR